MVDECDVGVCIGVETEILALKEGPSSEAGLERSVKRARGAADAGAGKGSKEGSRRYRGRSTLPVTPSRLLLFGFNPIGIE